MKNGHQTLDKIVDLGALKKRTDVEDIYDRVPDDVTEARQAMLFAMERHDTKRICEVIQGLEGKIAEHAKKSPCVGYMMTRKQINAACVDAYRHVINIGRLALHGLSPTERFSGMPVEPMTRWDA